MYKFLLTPFNLNRLLAMPSSKDGSWKIARKSCLFSKCPGIAVNSARNKAKASIHHLMLE